MKKLNFSSLFRRKGGHTGRVAIYSNGHHVQFARIDWVEQRPVLASYEVQALSANTSAELLRACQSVKLSSFNCSFLLQPSEYQLLMVDAPNVPMEEMKSAIGWKIKDSLHQSVDDTTLDVLPIPSSHQGAERSKSLYVVAAANKLIKQRMEMFATAKLNLEVIDVPEMAQRNMASLFEEPGRCLAMLAFDESGGLLTFTSDGELYMSRRIEVSSGQLCDVNDDMRYQIQDRIELEVQRSLDYVDRQFNHMQVNRLLLAAPAECGLQARLSGNISVPVVTLDIAEVMDISSVPALASSELQVDAFYALGAAMRKEVAA